MTCPNLINTDGGGGGGGGILSYLPSWKILI